MYLVLGGVLSPGGYLVPGGVLSPKGCVLNHGGCVLSLGVWSRGGVTPPKFNKKNFFFFLIFFFDFFGDPPRSRLRYMVNEQPVRILLECILVFIVFPIL